jgi:hypothetical protein
MSNILGGLMLRKKKKILFYSSIRIIMGLLFVLNVIGIFFIKDDSQQSRLAFNAAQSFLLLIATILPPFLEKKARIDIPDFMEIIFVVMCICHFVLGEIGSFYIRFKWWDSMLHTLSGSMIAILAYSLVGSLNLENNKMTIVPLFVSIFAICFSITIGVLWEIVEFGADHFFGTNMQRYANSNTLEPFVGRIALKDTMKDLILDFMGAVFISIIGFIDMKRKREAFRRWIIRKDLIKNN